MKRDLEGTDVSVSKVLSQLHEARRANLESSRTSYAVDITQCEHYDTVIRLRNLVHSWFERLVLLLVALLTVVACLLAVD